MTAAAFALILLAALAHATWNLLAKKAGGGVVFVWLYAITSTVLWAPLALPILIGRWHRIVFVDWVFLIGSGLVHTVYFLVLQRAYRAGDLSFVYPLARGIGPLLSTVGAIVLLRERPRVLTLIGGGLIIISIFVFAIPYNGQSSNRNKGAIFLASITGLLIAFYTIWDAHAVAALAIPALLMEWMTGLTRCVCLFPFVAVSRDSVLENWRIRHRYAWAIGVLNPLAYLCVLIAMKFTPIVYVAPGREVSILIGAILGARLLNEGNRHQRTIAACLMLLGIALLAIPQSH